MSDTTFHIIKMGGSREDIALIITAATMVEMGAGSIQATSNPFEYTLVATGVQFAAFFHQLDILGMAYRQGRKAIVPWQETKPDVTS
jgi:hypothetical protein